MYTDFIKVNGQHFEANGRKIVFRGYGLGNFLNLEHFMIGLPGTESQLRSSIIESYGAEKAKMFWEKFYECYVSEKDFEFMKNLGINAVRIPFNYHHFESDQLPYTYNEDGFKQIDRVLALCEKYGIYAILDMHAAPGGQNPDWHSDNPVGESLFWIYADFRNRAYSLWQYIARRYKDNPWIAAYDIINEPVAAMPDGDRLVSEFSQTMVQKVREVDKNHVIFLEGNNYAMIYTFFEPSSDPNVAYTFHYYPSFAESELRNGNLHEKINNLLFRDISVKYMKETLKRPVWCGETGIPLYPSDRKYMEDINRTMLQILEDNDISWTLWCYKDARGMGTVHPRADSSWMDFSKKACEGWIFWDEFYGAGEIVKQWTKPFSVEPDDILIARLRFRYMAANMAILTQRYSSLFASIPFDELMKYPESFRFENCEIWNGITDMVKKYTLQDLCS